MKSVAKEYIYLLRKANVNLKVTIVLVFFVSLVQNAYLTTFNLYLSSIGFSTASIGKILLFSNLGSAAFAMPVGLLGDRFGHRRLILISSFVICINVALQAVATNSLWLSILSFLYGVSGLVIHISVYPFLSENCSSDERVQVFSLAFVVTYVGGILGSLLSGSLGKVISSNELLSIRISLLSISLAGFAASFLYFKTRETRITRFEKKPEVDKDGFVEITSKFGFHSALIGLGAGLVLPYFNLYFKSIFGFDAVRVGLIFSVSSFFFLLFGFLGPRLSGRHGAFKGGLIYEALSIPFIVAFTLKPPLPIAVLSFWLRGGLMNAALPLLSSFQMENINESRRGTFSALLLLIDNIFRSAGTYTGGLLISRRGFETSFAIMAFLYSISIAYIYFSFRSGAPSKKGKP